MKVTYLEEIKSGIALSQKMLCPLCGNHIYRIVHKLQPEPASWHIECRECGCTTPELPSRSLAKVYWKLGMAE